MIPGPGLSVHPVPLVPDPRRRLHPACMVTLQPVHMSETTCACAVQRRLAPRATATDTAQQHSRTGARWHSQCPAPSHISHTEPQPIIQYMPPRLLLNAHHRPTRRSSISGRLLSPRSPARVLPLREAGRSLSSSEGVGGVFPDRGPWRGFEGRVRHHCRDTLCGRGAGASAGSSPVGHGQDASRRAVRGRTALAGSAAQLNSHLFPPPPLTHSLSAPLANLPIRLPLPQLRRHLDLLGAPLPAARSDRRSRDGHLAGGLEQSRRDAAQPAAELLGRLALLSPCMRFGIGGGGAG